MVTHQLEAADDLTNGEEAQHLGEQDASAGDLCGGDVAGRVED